MANFSGGLIFPLVGSVVSLIVVSYYIVQVRDFRGLFRGSLNSYFALTAEYSAVSGLVVSLFFVILLLPDIFMKAVIPGLYVADIFFLTLTGLWIALAYKMFAKLESMSEMYFSEGKIE